MSMSFVYIYSPKLKIICNLCPFLLESFYLLCRLGCIHNSLYHIVGIHIMHSSCLQLHLYFQTRNAIEKTLEAENTNLYHKLGLHWRLTRQRCDNSSLMEYVSSPWSDHCPGTSVVFFIASRKLVYRTFTTGFLSIYSDTYLG